MRYFICFSLVLIVGFISFTAGASPGEQSRPEGPVASRGLAPVLLVDGGDTVEANEEYHAFMDSYFGAGNWDLYDLPGQGLPNPPELFLGVLGQYQGVLWHIGTGQGASLLAAANGILADYLEPDTPDSPAGSLLLVAPNLNTVLGNISQLNQKLGLFSLSAPTGNISFPVDSRAMALVPDLSELVVESPYTSGTGIQPLEGSEILYQMEFCLRCYSVRPPYDPIVGIRNPDRQTSVRARAVTLTIPVLQTIGGWNSLATLMKYHLGFIPTWEAGSGAGKARLSINNAGYVGNFFASPDNPSLVYPYPGYVEHLYHGGIWLGARLPDGSLHVSTSADDYTNNVVGEVQREFAPTEEEVRITSNQPGSEFYDPAALAPWQLECSFHDQMQPGSGGHVPLGVKVLLRAMAWDDYPIDDGVILEYRVINESGADLRDVYFGFFNDTTVGNIQITSPYNDGTYPSWNYYDDVNCGWRPGDVPGDPEIWMMSEHDADGDEGWATSWVGCRLLGVSHEVEPEPGVPPVSYNAWSFAHAPDEDDFYLDEDSQTMVPGRYQAMGNGDFDSGGEFAQVYDWLGLLSTGPVASLAAGDTLRVAFGLVCGEGQWELLQNSRRLARLAANGWHLDASPAMPELPGGVHLAAAVPNPFNPSTQIAFSLDRSGWTRLAVYSLDGRLVKILVDDVRPAGQHRVSWQGQDQSGSSVGSGLYLYRLTAPDGTRRVGQMTLLK
jgi:hypothetical protein